MEEHADMLARLTQIVAHAPQDTPLAARMCRAVVEILAADGGALTLASTRPERLTVFTSDGTSERIENLQEVLGEGPGQDAYASGRLVVAEVDGFSGGPFPMFTEMAGDITGPVHLYAIPMHSAETTIGVMTLYRTHGEVEASADRMQFLGDAVGAALLGGQHARDVLSSVGWQQRSRVHQATGMVVAQLAVAPSDALALLRAHAYSQASSLETVADAVVARRLVFSSAPDGAQPGTTIENGPADNGTKNGER
ncbi:ANTAR domain-containing protein [Cellulomonas sp. PhB143]|uniref:ANTAR domain-containing protein n=1 Tax=Cellulomonas sp. PhB143 TaxID=2485186 RepID=UPI001315404F|nr:ANTAR domain-containing protein [Cellulomonas sp. PhB143]